MPFVYEDLNGKKAIACRWLGCNNLEMENFLGNSGYCKGNQAYLKDNTTIEIGKYVVRSAESTLTVLSLGLFLEKYTLADLK